MYYVFLITAALFTAGQFIFLKLFQKEQGESVFSASFFSAFVGITQMIFAFVVNGFKMSVSLFSIICAFIMAALVICNNIFGVKVMKMGKISIYTLFLMSGGMVVPFFYGILFLKETLKPLGVLSVALIILALLIPSFEKTDDKKTGSKKFYLLCFVLFLVNGTVSSVIKTHQIGKNAVNSFEFLFWIAFFQAVISFAVVAATKKNNRPLEIIKKKKPLLFCAGFGIVNGLSSFLQFFSAAHVNASVQFPILTGGSIVFSALLAYLFFKEKLNKYTVLSIITAFLATCLFLF